MRQVYLLLRNNLEIGPFSIDELLQQQLQPTDLVWVEGKSQAWSYPSEIPELQKLMNDKKPGQNAARRVGSVSKDEIESRAEQLRQKLLLFKPYYIPQPELPPSQSHNDALREEREAAIEFVDHRKQRFAASEVVTAAFVTVLLGAGVYGGQSLIAGRQGEMAATPTARVITAETIAPTPKPRPAVVIPPAALQDTLTDTVAAPVRITASVRSEPRKEVLQPDTTTETMARVVVAPAEEKKEEPVGKKQDIVQSDGTKEKDSKEEKSAKDTRNLADSSNVAEASAEPEKKKGIGGFFKGLFKKKKKDADKPEEKVEEKAGN